MGKQLSEVGKYKIYLMDFQQELILLIFSFTFEVLFWDSFFCPHKFEETVLKENKAVCVDMLNI